MISLDNFLEHVHQELSSQNNTQKVWVSGNDSADLDSIISSLLFAYFSHLQQNDSNKKKLYIPLIKVPKADLELRPELKYVLNQVNLDYKKLITLDQIDVSQPTDIVLIDHNQLTPPFNGTEWSNHVVGVLDHHIDEELYLNAPIRTVNMVGSCVTLVLNQFKIKDSSDWVDEQIARLAMAPLLVDTVNLKWDLGRTTKLDIEIFEILQEKLGNDELQLNSYFKSIEKVKGEVDNMSNYDILRRDYKEFSNVNGYRIGTSAVTWNFRAWIEKENGGVETISKAAIDYAKERGLDMEVIFTAFDYDREGIHGGDYRRELAIFIINQDLMPIKDLLEKNLELELKSIFSNFYEQGNIKMSRKQVWPLLKQLIEANN